MTAVVKTVSVLLVVAVLIYLMILFNFLTFFRRRKSPEKFDSDYLKQAKNSLDDEKYDRIISGRKWLDETHHTEEWIKSDDGLNLHARLYPGKNPNVTFILCHGYHSSGEHDFAYTCQKYASFGFNVLVIDQRSHGKSDGKYICFGAKEKLDIINWCNYVNEKFGENGKIILSGVSMGCTSVLLAACDKRIPPNVCGVVADCGFRSPYEQFRHVLKKNSKLPPAPILSISNLICKHRAGFNFREFDLCEELKTIKIPVLFIHGESDDFVPCDNSLQNYAACASDKTLLVIPNSEHAMSSIVATQKYEQALTEFVENLNV